LTGYLSWAGISLGVASWLAPLLRPVGVVVALFWLVTLCVRLARSHQRGHSDPPNPGLRAGERAIIKPR
jgi:hypothetical protein